MAESDLQSVFVVTKDINNVDVSMSLKYSSIYGGKNRSGKLKHLFLRIKNGTTKELTDL